jgi:hypothetical protein
MPFWGGPDVIVINGGVIPPVLEFPRKRPVTAGELIPIHRFTYIKASDGLAYLTDKTDSATFPCYGMSEAQILMGATGNVIYQGEITDAGWAFVKGNVIVAGTAGAAVKSSTLVSGNFKQELGEAISATTISISVIDKDVFEMP